MADLHVRINVDNAAFGCDRANDPVGAKANIAAFEVARILRDLAAKISESGGLPLHQPLRDINGNTVGEAELKA